MTESKFDKSLRLMDEHLDQVSDDEFVKTYLECERTCDPNGITVDEYLEYNTIEECLDDMGYDL